MPQPWLIRVYERGQMLHQGECAGPIELGRMGHPGEALYSTHSDHGPVARVVIAGPTEDRVSRRHAYVEELRPGAVRVVNRSRKAPIGLPDGRVLEPGQQCELALPAVLALGNKSIRIQEVGADEFGASLQGLEQPTLGPRSAGLERSQLAALGLSPASLGTENEAAIRCLQVTLDVLKSAATDTDFFQKGARAVVEGIGLDSGRVLALHDDEWKTMAYHVSPETEGLPAGVPSQGVLERVRREARTFWRTPSVPGLNLGGEDGSSLVGITSVVAAPILDAEDQVIAILYGDRRQFPVTFGGAGRAITKFDAMLVDLIAGSIAAGLARLDHQRAALAMQARFEQFFTPELARQLAGRSELLIGQDLEITVLFCDICGFSRITRNLGPARTLEWVGDVLSTLSDCALDRQGVLVDYIGDELMAMWGAPEAQPDHAERATLAALDMLDALPQLNARWESVLGEPMGLGIGVNTGVARVGNTGSRRKFKYGPLGDTVNVASRVQGANKFFKTSLLLTQATRQRLGPRFPTRRLGAVRVVNITDPIELHELAPPDQPGWPALCAAYETALTAFESRSFRQAARILGTLLEEHVDDGPALALLSRAVACMVEAPDPFDPAFILPGK
jgi:adenylate cyclase